VKKRCQTDAKIELIIKEKPRKKQKTSQNSTFQTETPGQPEKQAEQLKRDSNHKNHKPISKQSSARSS